MAKTVIKKRKRPEQSVTTEAPPGQEAATKTAETVPATAVPAPVPAQINTGAPAGKSPKYGPFAVLMLIATLCFVGLVIIQWVEWRYYHEPPTAFLNPQGMVAPSP